VTGQLDAFRDAVALAERAGVEPEVRHVANSAATLTSPAARFDLVRPGIAVYGVSPMDDVAPREFGLRPAMTLTARLALVKRVPAGSGVSYGHAYVTASDTTLGLVPLGYADGVPRAAARGARCWRPVGSARSPAGCAWTRSSSTWATMRGGRRRGRALRLGRGWRAAGRRLGARRGHDRVRDRHPRRPARAARLHRRAGVSGLRGIGRRAGLGVGAVGVGRRGCGGGWAAERYAVGRSWRGTADPAAGEPFGVLVGQTRMVAASDGVPLFVEVVEHVEDPELTLVLCHGYSLNLDAWHYQRRDLDDVGRLVLFDQRGPRPVRARHGRERDHRPARRRPAPRHHRGGARGTDRARRPLDGRHDRHGVRGAAPGDVRRPDPRRRADRDLAGRIAEVTLGVPAAVARVAHRVAPRALRSLVRQAELVERGRRAGSDLSYVLTKRYSFGGDPPPSVVEFVAEMIAATRSRWSRSSSGVRRARQAARARRTL
jgi:hypothetical protein